jgi:cobalt-zinc-cadmium efflux system outer membrane protein
MSYFRIPWWLGLMLSTLGLLGCFLIPADTDPDLGPTPIETAGEPWIVPSVKPEPLSARSATESARATDRDSSPLIQLRGQSPDEEANRNSGVRPGADMVSPVRPNSAEAVAEPASQQALESDLPALRAQAQRDAKPGNSPADSPLPSPKRIEPTHWTLDTVVEMVLRADPRLRAAFELVNQERANAITASLPPNPQLTVGVLYLPLRSFTPQRQGGPPELNLSVSYAVDWFMFGKRAAAMEAARLGVRVSEAELAELTRLRVLEASLAYFDVLEAKTLRELAQQDVEHMTQLESITAKAVEGGGRPLVELQRVRLERLRSEQALREAELRLASSKAKLLAMLGQMRPLGEWDLAGSLDEIRIRPPLPTEEALSVALENRPDLQAARWRVAQAQAELESERRKAYPAISLQAGYNRQYQQAIGFPDADSYSVSLTLDLPVWDRNQGNRARALSLLVQRQYEMQAETVELYAEILQAEQELRTAAENVAAMANEQLRLADQVRQAITQAYKAGGRSLVDVLDAERNYRDIYRLYVTSRANYARAAVRYSATLGRAVLP